MLAEFAGGTADAFTLFERFEGKLEEHGGNLTRAAVELAKDWRTDRMLRRLEALLAVADAKNSLVITGNGDVIEPEHGLIAIGSGGFDGKGFTQGTQSQLDFIPEQHTDFIFTVVAEEFGFLGAAALLLVWLTVIVWGFVISIRSHSLFGRFAGIGAVATMAFYVAFNVGMVAGLLPVVGIPLPLISYGGTAMITVMAAFGLILSVYLHREDKLKGR